MPLVHCAVCLEIDWLFYHEHERWHSQEANFFWKLKSLCFEDFGGEKKYPPGYVTFNAYSKIISLLLGEKQSFMEENIMCYLRSQVAHMGYIKERHNNRGRENYLFEKKLNLTMERFCTTD